MRQCLSSWKELYALYALDTSLSASRATVPPCYRNPNHNLPPYLLLLHSTWSVAPCAVHLAFLSRCHVRVFLLTCWANLLGHLPG